MNHSEPLPWISRIDITYVILVQNYAAMVLKKHNSVCRKRSKKCVPSFQKASLGNTGTGRTAITLLLVQLRDRKETNQEKVSGVGPKGETDSTTKISTLQNMLRFCLVLEPNELRALKGGVQ